jgi:hypothetical protein
MHNAEGEIGETLLAYGSPKAATIYKSLFIQGSDSFQPRMTS